MAEELKKTRPAWLAPVGLFVLGAVLGGVVVFLVASGGGSETKNDFLGGDAGTPVGGWAESAAMQAIQAIQSVYGKYGEWDYMLHQYPNIPVVCRVMFIRKTPKGHEERITTYVEQR